MEGFKSNSYDIDGISTFHLNTDLKELVYHLYLFPDVFCSSLVPDYFSFGNIASILKRDKDPTNCASYRPITVA